MIIPIDLDILFSIIPLCELNVSWDRDVARIKFFWGQAKI